MQTRVKVHTRAHTWRDKLAEIAGTSLDRDPALQKIIYDVSLPLIYVSHY